MMFLQLLRDIYEETRLTKEFVDDTKKYFSICQKKTSVIIPSKNEKYLNRTVQNLLDTSDGDIEIIVVLDGYMDKVIQDDRVKVIYFKDNCGERHAMNEAVKISTGEFLFRIDAHCTMSIGWDTKLKYSVPNRGIIVSSISVMNEKKWECDFSGKFYSCYLTSEMEEKWDFRCKEIEYCNDLEPIMAFMGCGWMIKKDYYSSFGGADESLPKMGAIGSEFTLQAWLDGDGVFSRTDVECCHLFNTGGYPVEGVLEARRKLKLKWGEKYSILLDKFPEVKQKINYKEIKKSMKDIKDIKDIKISVVIPTGEKEKIENINKTINSLLDNSFYNIEIIILADGWEPDAKKLEQSVIISSSSTNLGERKTVNRGFKIVTGDYVLRIDAHCAMSKNWDKILLSQYKKNTISLCVLDALEEETWTSLNHRYTFVYVSPSCEEKWWGEYIEDDSLLCEPSMSLTGCGWFCEKQLFLDKLQFDEDLSKWGCIGPEMTAKIEKINSSIIVNKNVTCLHLFDTNAGYSVSEVSKTRKKILDRYAKEIYSAAKRFKAPEWENIKEDYILDNERVFMYNTEVNKKDQIDMKDEQGNIIKKIIKIYHPVKYKGKENPDIPSVGKKITKDAKLKKIKIATLNANDEFDYEVIEDKKEIELWLFENE